MPRLSTDEKIDYIYNRLRRDDIRERNREIIKWIFRLSIVCFILYFYLVGFQKLREEFIQSVTPDTSGINTQSIYESVSNLLKTNEDIK